MRVPRPRDGWRAFGGEVGVIVLGVLLALGAQQAVEAWQIRKDVRTFRQTIDQEIAFNLYAVAIRDGQIDCNLRQQAAVAAWLVRSRAGGALPPIQPSPPGLGAPYASAWNSRDAETYRQLPADARRRYAMLYDLLASMFANYKEEVQAWQRLQRFGEPGPVSVQERRDAATDLAFLDNAPRWDRVNSKTARTLAAEMGIRAIRPQDIPPWYAAVTRKCRPLETASPQP